MMDNRKIDYFKYQHLILRIGVVITATILTILFFPKSDRFSYDFKKGEPWQYETLYAPFPFPIKKSTELIAVEEAQIRDNATKYFDVESKVEEENQKKLITSYYTTFSDSLTNEVKDQDVEIIKNTISKLYENYYFEGEVNITNDQKVIVNNGNEWIEISFGSILVPKTLNSRVSSLVNSSAFSNKLWLTNELFQKLEPNLIFNQSMTNQFIEDQIGKILPTRGKVPLNSRIIAQGEIVEGENYQILKTLNDTYRSQTWSESQYIWKFFGYIILVGLTYTMLMLFLFRYRLSIYNNLRKLLFIYFNVLSIILLTTLIINIESSYIYVVPVCILPLILQSFFDARVGLFTHVITVLIISFIVPNSEEYLFLQIITGIVTILANSQIYKRANLFITIGQIVVVYITGYFAFYAINQGGIVGWEWNKIGYFVLCGLAMLFVWPLIYIYERVFGLVSDVSLLELSDTNSKLLKELSNKAPGTFHHSLNVANIAETAANAIHANAMLVRVGALYHDIGKMHNPTYFTENQGNGINPHDDLDPEESAEIIIEHTLKGIEIAKKNKIPDRVIDFIRTHHGDSLVYYFYKKSLESNTEAVKENFKYPGPKPFSPETAILMISDSVEAASKSISKPTSVGIDSLVEKIVNKQVEEQQFINADITFKQIETIKSVIKKKLASIYHLRIEYPE